MMSILLHTNALVQLVFMMMEYLFASLAIILGFFFAGFLCFSSLACSEENSNECTSCNVTDTYRTDNHIISGECPC